MSETRRFVDVAHGRLSCRIGTGDGPAVVLVHGFSVDHAMWDPQMPALAGRATVRYDMRGFGESGLPDPRRGHLEDLVELLDALELGSVVAVGLSLGANVCLALAAHHPDRVAAAILAAPGLPGRSWTSPRPPDLAMEHARRHGVAATRAYWLDQPLFAATRERPAAWEALVRLVDRFPGHQWSSAPAGRPLPAVADDLEGVSVPVVVVSGERDDVGYLSIADELVDRLPAARGTRIDGAGHFVNLDEPEQFNGVLADVMASVAGHDQDGRR